MGGCAEGAGGHFHGEGGVEVEVDEVCRLDGGLSQLAFSFPNEASSVLEWRGGNSQCP